MSDPVDMAFKEILEILEGQGQGNPSYVVLRMNEATILAHVIRQLLEMGLKHD